MSQRIVSWFISRDDEPRDRTLRVVAKRIGRAEVGLRRGDSRSQAGQDSRFAGAAGDQVERVDGAPLADAVDPADSLLEPHRVPRQLQVDDERGTAGGG